MHSITFLLLLALIIWVVLKITFAAITSPIFWIVFAVLVVAALFVEFNGKNKKLW